MKAVLPTRDELIARFVAALLTRPGVEGTTEGYAQTAERMADKVIARRPMPGLPGSFAFEGGEAPGERRFGLYGVGREPMRLRVSGKWVTIHDGSGNGVAVHLPIDDLREFLDYVEATS